MLEQEKVNRMRSGNRIRFASRWRCRATQCAAAWHCPNGGDEGCIKFPVGTEGEVKGCNKDHLESLKMPHVSSN